MKNFNHQPPKHTCARAIAPVSAMSRAFEGYSTPSIRGLNDQGEPGGFIEGEKIPRI